MITLRTEVSGTHSSGYCPGFTPDSLLILGLKPEPKNLHGAKIAIIRIIVKSGGLF